MTHDEFKDKVLMLHDGELPAGERPEVERHLASCAECRAALDGWKAAARTFFRKPAAEPSEAFVAAVMARIDTEKGWLETLREAFSPRRVALAGAAAFAALALFFAAPLRQPRTAAPESIQYVADLADETEDEAGLGTSVEEYFL